MTKDQILKKKPLKTWEFREYQKGGLLENGIALNETGILIYKLCDGKNSVGQIVNEICTIYEVSRDKAEVDTVDCIESLFEEEAIK